MVDSARWRVAAAAALPAEEAQSLEELLSKDIHNCWYPTYMYIPVSGLCAHIYCVFISTVCYLHYICLHLHGCHFHFHHFLVPLSPSSCHTHLMFGVASLTLLRNGRQQYPDEEGLGEVPIPATYAGRSPHH